MCIQHFRGELAVQGDESALDRVVPPVVRVDEIQVAARLDDLYLTACYQWDEQPPPASFRSRSGGNEWEPLTKGLPQEHCYVNVLRDAMAVDSLDACGVYFGTTGGQVYASADAGDSWAPIVRDLPAVVSVEVQTLP